MKNTELEFELDEDYVLLESEQRTQTQAIELEALQQKENKSLSGQGIVRTVPSQTDQTLPVLQNLEDEAGFISSIPLPSCFNEVESEDDAIFHLRKIERSVSAPAEFNTEFEQEKVAVSSSQEYFQQTSVTEFTTITDLLDNPTVTPSELERNDSSDSLELMPEVATLSDLPQTVDTTEPITITSLLGDPAIIPNELERGLNLELIEEVDLVGKSRDCCAMPDLCTML